MTAPVTPTPALDQSSSGAATTSTAPTSNTQLSSQAFLKLLVAQLQYQDPSSPADMNSFMSETATLNQMETMQQLASVTSQLLQQAQTTQALALIGKTVSFTGTDGTTGTGQVSAVSMSSSPPALTVGNSTVPLSSVSSVLNPES